MGAFVPSSVSCFPLCHLGDAPLRQNRTSKYICGTGRFISRPLRRGDLCCLYQLYLEESTATGRKWTRRWGKRKWNMKWWMLDVNGYPILNPKCGHFQLEEVRKVKEAFEEVKHFSLALSIWKWRKTSDYEGPESKPPSQICLPTFQTLSKELCFGFSMKFLRPDSSEFSSQG